MKTSGGTGAGSIRSGARVSSLAWVALAGSGMLYGYNWVVMKSALRYESSAVFAATRVFGGAIFLFLLLLVLRRPLRPTNWLMTIVIGLFGMTGSIGLSVWALASGGAGKTSVLVYSMPVWLLLMSWFILGERLRGVQWWCVAVALLGLIFVISPWKPEGSALTNVLGVGAGVCSAASGIAAKLLFRDRRVDLLTLNAWQMLFGSIPLLAIMFLTSDIHSIWSWSSWYIVTLLYNVILVCGVSLYLWFYSLRHLQAGTAGLGRLTAPVIGVIASWIQLGERPDRYELVGIVLILAGLFALAAQQMVADRRPARMETAAIPVPVLADQPRNAEGGEAVTKTS
jgi:drug/metabolite transporter (DMT)-like permease